MLLQLYLVSQQLNAKLRRINFINNSLSQSPSLPVEVDRGSQGLSRSSFTPKISSHEWLQYQYIRLEIRGTSDQKRSLKEVREFRNILPSIYTVWSWYQIMVTHGDEFRSRNGKSQEILSFTIAWFDYQFTFQIRHSPLRNILHIAVMLHSLNKSISEPSNL